MSNPNNRRPPIDVLEKMVGHESSVRLLKKHDLLDAGHTQDCSTRMVYSNRPCECGLEAKATVESE